MQRSLAPYYGSRMGNRIDARSYFRVGTKPCEYKGYKCPLLCIENYKFCSTHILQDRKAPFQQCAFVYSYSSKRCLGAAFKSESGGGQIYCHEHIQKIQRAGRKRSTKKPLVTPQTLLTSLSHHIASEVKPAEVNHALTTANIDYCSESESDVDSTILPSTMCCEEDLSDLESVDSAEDPFRFATAMTVEEGLERAKEKTMRLESLYRDQLTRLQHLLRERRRDYIQNIQVEKETLCSIAQQCATSKSVRDIKIVEKIGAFNRYKRSISQQAILRRKMKLKRDGVVGESSRHTSKCIFAENGVKCNIKTIPAVKYCFKHILNDPYQQLFKPCQKIKSQSATPCQEPLSVLEPCIYHMETVPTRISYNSTTSSSEEDENNSAVHAIDSSMREPGSEEGEIKVNDLNFTQEYDGQFVHPEMDYCEEVVVTDE